jgi:hypothetical protein
MPRWTAHQRHEFSGLMCCWSAGSAVSVSTASRHRPSTSRTGCRRTRVCSVPPRLPGSLPSAQQALRPVLDGLGNYEALAGEAMYLDGQGASLPGRPPAAALVLYRQATDLLQGSILPAARNLTTTNAAALSSAYQAKGSAALQGMLWVVLLGAALLALAARSSSTPAMPTATPTGRLPSMTMRRPRSSLSTSAPSTGRSAPASRE